MIIEPETTMPIRYQKEQLKLQLALEGAGLTRPEAEERALVCMRDALAADVRHLCRENAALRRKNAALLHQRGVFEGQDVIETVPHAILIHLPDRAVFIRKEQTHESN